MRGHPPLRCGAATNFIRNGKQFKSSGRRSRRIRSNRRSRTHSESPARNPSTTSSLTRNEDDDTGNPGNEGANTESSSIQP